jgi:hypothetical protein
MRDSPYAAHEKPECIGEDDESNSKYGIRTFDRKLSGQEKMVYARGGWFLW